MYAVVTAACACPATTSALWMAPLPTVPGGNPVTAVPGLTPRSPRIVDGPVFVTVVPARTAKRKIGTLAALCTKATYAAEPVSVSISHCAPTVCIQLPTLLTKAAADIAANIG